MIEPYINHDRVNHLTKCHLQHLQRIGTLQLPEPEEPDLLQNFDTFIQVNYNEETKRVEINYGKTSLSLVRAQAQILKNMLKMELN